ncbi:MAG TPA: hypothetical protein VL551_34150 [Actinospica sp.]|nr:hypothetical protein [Actinospica sp.]
MEIHEHEEGLYLQRFPDCLAPGAEQRAALLAEYRDYIPGFDVPIVGDMVVLEAGCVWWLVSPDGTWPVAADSALVFAAPRLGRDHCEGADWGVGSGVGAVDPDDGALDQDVQEQARAILNLLLKSANAAV